MSEFTQFVIESRSKVPQNISKSSINETKTSDLNGIALKIFTIPNDENLKRPIEEIPKETTSRPSKKTKLQEAPEVLSPKEHIEDSNEVKENTEETKDKHVELKEKNNSKVKNSNLKVIINRLDELEKRLNEMKQKHEDLPLSLVNDYYLKIKPFLGKVTPLEIAKAQEDIESIPQVKSLDESIYTGLYLKTLWDRSQIKSFPNPSFVLSDIPPLVFFPFSIEHTSLLAKLFDKVIDPTNVDYNNCKTLFFNLPLVTKAQYFIFSTIYGDIDSRLWSDVSKKHMISFYYSMKLKKSTPFPLDDKIQKWVRSEHVNLESDWKAFVFKYYKEEIKK